MARKYQIKQNLRFSSYCLITAILKAFKLHILLISKSEESNTSQIPNLLDP